MPPKTRKRAKKADDPEDVENVVPETKIKKDNIVKALEVADSSEFSGQIDPDKAFPHQNCRVYVENGVVYDATLNQTDLKSNNNKFYILQILKQNDKDTFFYWARWGRVGYAGQNSCVELSLDAAKREFVKKFGDKTGNSFENRWNFEKKPKKYDLIQIDYGKSKPPPIVDGIKEDKNCPSELDARVKAVIDTICNLKALETYLKSRMKYDTDRSPLGALKKTQIKAGFEILSRIEELLLKNDTGGEYRDLINDYLTKIPHSFGMKRLDAFLTSVEQIKDELALLEALADVELANSVLKEEPSVRTINPSDLYYEKLHCKMTPLDKKDKDYKVIETYLKNTHGNTHTSFEMKLVNVFKIERENEAENFRADLHNHRLLWHGSPLTNWVGILLRGLRIAPPEAPSTGYMFGKGIYFADSCSKSGNYCNARIGERGFMTLAQVALGNMRELTESDYEANKLPKDSHSTFGVGMHEPSARGSKKMTIDGKEVAVPCGRLSKKKKSDEYGLIYNEFIVYNVNQVRMRFLVEVEFVRADDED